MYDSTTSTAPEVNVGQHSGIDVTMEKILVTNKWEGVLDQCCSTSSSAVVRYGGGMGRRWWLAAMVLVFSVRRRTDVQF